MDKVKKGVCVWEGGGERSREKGRERRKGEEEGRRKMILVPFR